MRAIKVHTFQKEKYTLVFGAFILGFTLLAGRLCYLMIFRSEELSKKALNIEQRERTIKAARGKIYDRNGIVLADNQAVCSVSVIYYQIKEPQKVIKLLSQKLALSEEEVKKKVEKVSSREKIKSNVPKSVADEIREAGLDGVKESWQKYSKYPEKPNTKTGMREIIRMERLNELACEGKRFWDLRRWKKELPREVKGWYVQGETAQEFYRVTTLYLRSRYSFKDYLWPLKVETVLKDPNLGQNPGW